MKRIYHHTGLTVHLFVLCFFLQTFFYCNKNQNPFSSYINSSFAIYFLRNDELKMKDVYDKDLNDLKLSFCPWICDDDIRFYDWSSHCIYLKKDKTHFFPNWQNNKFNEFPPEWADKPFVVVANGKRCYIGYFSSVLSHYWITPEISDGYNSMYPSDVLFIDWIWLYHDYPQNNEDVKNALINAELYHGGISVTFDTTDVNTLRMVENADTSTISYKFTITNNDEDDLYVIDPDKTGSGIFHRYTNGPVFKNLETGKLYESRYKITDELPSIDYWSPDWFTKLKSGHSIQRTVVLKGYPYFPTGEYIFQFMYNGPVLSMQKGVRELADGRYWLGPTRSNILVWNFKASEDSLNRKLFTRKNLEKTSYQQINDFNSAFIDEYLPVTPTQQQLGLKRR